MKLHARVTKCIDVTKEEMDIVVKASTCSESILNDDEKKKVSEYIKTYSHLRFLSSLSLDL